MPTNQEFLTQLATESPEKLKAWFDAEHNDTLTAKNDVSGNAAHFNDEKVDTREQLEADVREWVDDIGWLSDKETQVADFIAWLDRQAAITERETFNHYSDELERRANREQKLQEQVDRLTRERDNLAKDLNDMMRSMDKLCDRFRDASSSALDNAHEIQRIIDNFWTV